MNNDRRKHRRLNLHLPVFLSRANGDFMSSETVNISTNGFYCRTKQAFTPGETLRCVISLQCDRSPGAEEGLCLDADVEVVRVIATGSDSDFGMGCQIQNYRIALGAKDR